MIQAQAQREPREEATLAFKRHILTASADFAPEPMADAFRVSLLGRMLDRYDALRAQGLSDAMSQSRVIAAFGDIPQQMRAQGFGELSEGDAPVSRWPQLTEGEADAFIQENDGYLHRIALGSALCSACVTPLMIGAAFTQLWDMDYPSLIGLMGMFGMIGMGVYTITSARKPKQLERVKEGRFSLSTRLRRRLAQLREEAEERASRRRGKGIAMLVTCIMPLLVGAALDTMWNNGFAPVLGLAPMFIMIGTGVYELIMADGEPKTLSRLMDTDEGDEPRSRGRGRRR